MTSRVHDGPDFIFVGILAGLVLFGAVLVVRGLVRRRDRSRVVCACGRDVGHLAFRVPAPCACGAIVGGPPNEPTTARLFVPPMPGRLGGRRPVSLVVGAACLVGALALAAIGAPTIAAGGAAIDLLPVRALGLSIRVAPEATLLSIQRRLRNRALTPSDAARILIVVSGSAQARSILLAPAPGQPENVLDYQLVSLAEEAGDLGREAFLALAAPVPKAGRDDKTGESLVWIEALTLFSDVWFARVEDVRLNGVSVPWSIDETPRLDGRPCRSKRVLRSGHLRVAVPYESLAAGNVEIRYVAAASVAAWAVAGDAIVNDDPPERWGIGGFAVPLVQRVECKRLGRGAQ